MNENVVALLSPIKTIRAHKILTAAFLALALTLIAIVNSFQFSPDPSGDASFINRAQQKSVPGIKVNASVLGADESERSLGENLAGYNIQPVWLSIENETDEALTLLPATMDPNYYSAYEVSYRFHGALSWIANRARDEFFLKRQIASDLAPHTKTTGFVYGVLDAGIDEEGQGHERAHPARHAVAPGRGRPSVAPTGKTPPLQGPAASPNALSSHPARRATPD